MVLPLTYLKSGEEGRVVWIASDLLMRQRLADQGIAPGSRPDLRSETDPLRNECLSDQQIRYRTGVGRQSVKSLWNYKTRHC